MVSSTRATPGGFGEALKGARLASGISLEALAGRTKISLRVLTALEAGDFGTLPDRVFARMFLRQYLEIVGVPAAEWLPLFDAAWQGHQDASHPSALIPGVPVRKRRFAPWAVGLALVTAGVGGLLLVADRPGARPAATPAAFAATAAPAVPPPSHVTPTLPAQPTAPPPGVLVVSTEASPCWVEVHVAGEEPASRLLPARSSWQVQAGGKEVDLVLGDAGAAAVEYVGEVRRPAGASGAVVRIHLDGSHGAATHR
jgi:cytoskeleton protein RodZ